MAEWPPAPVGLCVLLGAPRSGTTWLQRLLSGSAAVVSPQETHLFRLYLEPQIRQWEAHQQRVDTALDRLTDTGEVATRIFGLPTLLTREDFVRAQRSMVDAVLYRAARSKPNVSWVLEKTPSTSLCVDLVEELCSEARYVHIVRDPRDVVASLRAAGKTWAAWAPTDAASAADSWQQHVVSAMRAAQFAPDRYLQVRYEELRRRPEEILDRVGHFLHLPENGQRLVAEEQASQGRALPEVFAFRDDLAERLRGLPEAEPPGFRRGKEGRPTLSAVDIRVIDAVAGDLARRLGYTGGWPSSGAASRSVWRSVASGQQLLGSVRRRARTSRRRPVGAAVS